LESEKRTLLLLIRSAVLLVSAEKDMKFFLWNGYEREGTG